MGRTSRVKHPGTIAWVSSVVVVGVAAGCHAEARAPRSVVRDSLGVRISMTDLQDSALVPSCSVGEAPTLRIGSLMGDTTQELDGVRDAKRLRDDRVVVATSGSHDVRVFDAAGRLLAHLGREGDGPGEFRFPVKLGVVSADSVAVWDIALRRVSVFDLDDGSVREVDLRPPPAYPTTQFAVVDGDFVIGSRVNRPSRSARMVPQSLLLLRYSPSGTLVDTLETLPDGEAAWITAGAMAMFGPPLFGSHALIASGGTLLYATGGSTASVEALDSTGKVVAAVRWQSPDRRVTDADLSTYREDRLKRANAAARPQLKGAVEDLVVAGSVGRRIGEFGIGVLWALFCLMNFFPPSGQALAPWLIGPISALVSLHFVRRAFDGRPRLIVDSEGITDRTALVGSSLFVPWSDIVDVSLRWGSGVGLIVRDPAAVRRRAGISRRVWMRLEQALGVRTVPILLPVLSVGKRELKKRLEAGLLQFERRDLGLSASHRLPEAEEG